MNNAFVAILAFISLTVGLTYLISAVVRTPVIIKNGRGKIPASHMLLAAIGVSGFLTLKMFLP